MRSRSRDYAECGYITSAREQSSLKSAKCTEPAKLANAVTMARCGIPRRQGLPRNVHHVSSGWSTASDRQPLEERQLKHPLSKLARFELHHLGRSRLSSRSRLDTAHLLFQTVSDRYVKGSLIVTSNLPFAQWTSVFGDARTDRSTWCDQAAPSLPTNHQFEWESIRFTEQSTAPDPSLVRAITSSASKQSTTY